MQKMLVPCFAILLMLLSISDCMADPKLDGVAIQGSSGGGNDNNWAVGGFFGSFGKAPAKIKPLTTESSEPLEKDTKRVASDYDFSVDLVRANQPSYMPVARIAEHDLIAKNRGYAPVSVIVDADQEFLHANLPLPLVAVVPPNSEKSLVLLKRKAKNRNENIGYKLSWDLGNCNAQHSDNQNYQLPFGDNIRAFASVNEGDRKTTLYTKYAVVFSMPPKTAVLAARNGIVIRMKAKSRIDVLHDDSTIGTYSHLDEIDKGLFVGRKIGCGDVIGVAGISEDQKESYVQLTVWRLGVTPETSTSPAKAEGPTFNHVSLPLKFCGSDFKVCSVLAKSKPVWRSNPLNK